MRFRRIIGIKRRKPTLHSTERCARPPDRAGGLCVLQGRFGVRNHANPERSGLYPLLCLRKPRQIRHGSLGKAQLTRRDRTGDGRFPMKSAIAPSRPVTSGFGDAKSAAVFPIPGDCKKIFGFTKLFFKNPLHFSGRCVIISKSAKVGPLVKRSRRRPLTAKIWVRFP